MHPQKRTLAWVILLGGTCVLASYAYSWAVAPAILAGFWGGVPVGIRPAYSVAMLLAAAGFFAYSYFLLFRVDPSSARIASRFGYGLFPLLYLMILVPSALWTPLTAAMLDQGSAILWLAIRLVLYLVAAGSLGLLVALLALQPRQPAWAHRLAVAGSVAFCFQTALLDAVVWVALFPA
jgi:hypothetical protein